MKITQMSPNGIDFLMKEEGVRLKPYLDSRGIPTIGVGNTYYENGVKVKMSDPAISLERAKLLFKIIRADFENQVSKSITSEINQNQFDALVSLVYNIGMPGFRTSTVVRLVNTNPNDPAITNAFKMWKNAGGKPILLARRVREATLYFTK